MSEYVVLRLPLPGAVITYFVTSSRSTSLQIDDHRSWRTRIRHDHSAITGGSGAVARICERASAAGQSPSTALAASAWSSVAARLASRFRASWDGEPGSAVCTAILRPAPTDSFIVEAQDDGADDGAMEALDPGVMEAGL